MTQKQEKAVRRAFERWCLSGSRFYPIESAIDGSYFNALTNEAWKAYKEGAIEFSDVDFR